MKSLSKYVVLVGLFSAMSVYAAPDPSTPPPANDTPAKKEVVLTPAEMAGRAVVLDAQVKADGDHVQNLQETIRKQKDVIKLTCVNDKLVEIKPQLNRFDSQKQTYAGFAGGGDTEALRNSFTEMQNTANEVHQIALGADGCVGAPELIKQESSTTDHPQFPDDPTTEDPFDGANDTVEPPSYASPFT